MNHKIQLLIIDAQYDFCDPNGALYVPGAQEDMKRTTSMIRKGKDKIEKIRVTLDTHRKQHIAHPIWWIDENDNHPKPFTAISTNDVIGNLIKWRASNPEYNERSIEYVRQLERNGRYTLTIWPPHCLIGSNGHKIFPDIFDALDEWEDMYASVDYLTKGTNIFTEHYSAIRADVIDPDDNGTYFNTGFIERLDEAEIIGIAGEALSHCVANTVKDIADALRDNHIEKLVLLEDATSPVTGFEDQALDFIKEMKSRGMRIARTTDFPG
ncbi:MAG: hypothetical protein SVZ03_14420 [Spirochaetota bacterium]|nr:hypothetical protein [Spirochaetota bacterium]